ncbi:DUF1499 domain-containing protein [Salinarimonas soli]|uniref:DUF1499 domain-containing protein n=1 Tax=Salinarimonas soli TaxID=1638099 RepID=UPI001F0ADB06|nr:DUF1499 domain-containing protein [Salinarimonas soli]
MRAVLRLLGALVVVAGAGLAVLIWRGSEPGGIDDLYHAVVGGPDLGPVTFETLVRRSRPNDALACPADLCRSARPDIVPPLYPVSAERLREIVADVARQDPETQIVFSARWEEQDRYVARTRLMRFPDTINVRVVPVAADAATVAIYSRSQLGYSDWGVNRKRIERWLDAIAARAGRDA